MLFYVLTLAIVVIDQFIKQLVHQLMQLGQSIPLVDGILNITYVRNTGAAFSLFVGFSPYLAFVGVVVVIVVFILHYRLAPHRFWVQAALAFIAGGSLGNLADRFFRSYVIDYLDINFWPVFNFADIMINIGVIIFIVYIFKEEAKEIKEERDDGEIEKGLEHVSNTD